MLLYFVDEDEGTRPRLGQTVSDYPQRDSETATGVELAVSWTHVTRGRHRLSGSGRNQENIRSTIDVWHRIVPPGARTHKNELVP